jgi:cytolysin-activating lysine-acyltransferase
MLDHVINLLAQSETHKNWTVEQINRCITPPVNLKQCQGIIEDGKLVAWCSWGFLSDEKSDKFLTGEYRLQPNDWRSGNVLVFMDFVAPFGHTQKLYRMCRNLFPKYPKAEWRRHLKKRRVGAMLNVK